MSVDDPRISLPEKRVRMRGPCFFTTAGVERAVTGYMIADLIPCFGSMNVVVGECDR